MESPSAEDLRPVMERLNLATVDLSLDLDGLSEQRSTADSLEGASVSNFSVSLFSDDEFSSPGQITFKSTTAGQKLNDLNKSTLENKVEQLEHEICLLEIEVERERNRYSKDMASVRVHMQEQIEKVRLRQKELAEEVPLLRSRLECQMEELSDLRCSSELYQQLKAIPRSKLTIKEFVLINSYELSSSYRAQVESLRIELAKAKAAAEASKQVEEEVIETRDAMVTQHQRKVQRLAGRLNESESEIKILRQTCDDYRTTLETLRDKGHRYDNLSSKVEQLERNNSQIQAQLEHALEATKLATEERNRVQEEAQSNVQKLEMVNLDKAYLERELEQLRRKLDQMERAEDRRHEEVRELQEAKSNLLEKLQTVAEASKQTYDQRLDAQTESLQQRHEREIAQLKEMHSHIVEREIRHLRERYEASESQVQILSDKLSDVVRQNDDLKIQLATSDSRHQSEMLEVTSALKMKSFDLGRMTMSNEERDKEMERIRLENRMLSSKLEVLKEDFHALEQRSAREAGERTQELMRLKSGHSGMSDLDAELRAIALITAPEEGSANGHVGMDQRKLLNRVANLVEELKLFKQREENKDSEIESLKRAMSRLKKRIEDSAQPQVAIIRAMKERDDEIEARTADLASLADEYKLLKVRYGEVVETKKQLRSDLDQIISHREDLETLVKQQQTVVQQQQNELVSMKQQFESVMVPNGISSYATSPVTPTDVSATAHGSGLGHSKHPVLQAVSRRDETVESSFGQGQLEEVESDSEYDASDQSESQQQLDGTVFVWQKQDEQGIPLPRWYRRLRPPVHT